MKNPIDDFDTQITPEEVYFPGLSEEDVDDLASEYLVERLERRFNEGWKAGFRGAEGERPFGLDNQESNNWLLGYAEGLASYEEMIGARNGEDAYEKFLDSVE